MLAEIDRITSAHSSGASEKIEIRASGLPSAPDCFRRWAAGLDSLRPVLNRHGFDIKEEPPNIGATVGSACHEGIGAFLQAKTDGYQVDPYGKAVQKFRALTAGYLPVDRETPDASVAEQQISRMLHAYIPHAEALEVARCEFKLETRLDPIKNYFLTGHPDIQETNGNIRDMKFGKNLSAYEAQLGAYRLMLRSHGVDTKGLFVDWVKRGSLKQCQAPLYIVEYNVATAETAAFYSAEELMRQIEKFKETGNPWSFPANPNSKLCSKKWCPAHGTPFCDLGRPSASDD